MLKTKSARTDVVDPNRYKPRHAWYLADALLLVRNLQEQLWPLDWHVAMGGGVLNHGYSDKDLDLYVLPIYTNGKPGFLRNAVRVLMQELGTPTPIGGDVAYTPGEGSTAPVRTVFSVSLKYTVEGKRVDVFVVAP